MATKRLCSAECRSMGIINFRRKDVWAYIFSELGWLFFCFFQFLSDKAGDLKSANGNIMMALKYSNISSFGLGFMLLILLFFLVFSFFKGTSEEKKSIRYLLCFRIVMYLMCFLFPIYYNGD